MADCIDAVLDHLAIAVPDWRAAEARWRDGLGAGRSSIGRNRSFGSRQLRFANDAKLELLTPAQDAPPTNFVQRFLDRFGSTVHHLTLKVPDLHQALEVLTAAGLDAVDVNVRFEHWHEAFLRPSQIGGLVVQIARTPFDDDEWASFTGFVREAPRLDAATLHGPLLRHPDLGRARALWTVLGATVDDDEGGLRCRWPDSRLDVVIEPGEPAGPVGLRMEGAGEWRAAAPDTGPEVLERR